MAYQGKQREKTTAGPVKTPPPVRTYNALEDGFQKTFGIYYEVSNYDKLLSDARKRNRIFLDKLSLAMNH